MKIKTTNNLKQNPLNLFKRPALRKLEKDLITPTYYKGQVQNFNY